MSSSHAKLLAKLFDLFFEENESSNLQECAQEILQVHLLAIAKFGKIQVVLKPFWVQEIMPKYPNFSFQYDFKLFTKIAFLRLKILTFVQGEFQGLDRWLEYQKSTLQTAHMNAFHIKRVLYHEI